MEDEKELIDEQQPENERVEGQTGEEFNEQNVTDEQVEAEKKIAELENQVADLKDKNLRMMAEFDNYRRRTSQEKLNLKDATQDDMLKEFLPLVDDFERAMNAIQASDDINALREGVELIYNKVGAYLEKYGVKSIDTADQVFDVDLHEAIAMIPAPSEEQKGKVLDCVKKGYTRNDKVLRHAQVAVGQ